MEKRLALLMLLLAACRDPNTKKIEPPGPDAGCGDGVINPGEDCEGSDLAGASCQSLGFDTGSLTCGPDCRYVKTQCSKRCGNGVLDPGETCDGTLGVGTCLTFGYQSCSATCQLETNHCVPTLFEAGAALQATKGGPAVVGDLAPKGFGDLVMAVPSFFRVQTFSYTLGMGFVTGRTLSFGRTPVLTITADLDGDGQTDVAAINDDGTIDRYLYSGSSFAVQPFADAGCAAARFLGVAPADGGGSLIAAGCADGGAFNAIVVQPPSGAPSTLPVQAVAATLGDLDGDGRLDVLFISAAGLESRLAPGWSAGVVQSIPSTPLEIAAGDFDHDGDLDLAALDATGVALWENVGGSFALKTTFAASGARSVRVVDLDLDGKVDVLWELGDKVQVRRNQGAWSFATTEGTFGPGAPISLAVGDVDGDGDLDLVSTRSAGGDATVSYVLVNKVR